MTSETVLTPSSRDIPDIPSCVGKELFLTKAESHNEGSRTFV